MAVQQLLIRPQVKANPSLTLATRAAHVLAAHHPANAHTPLLEANSDVVLIDIQSFAALVGMSASWIREEVSANRAPKPALQGPRCTRWKLSDVRQYLIRLAELGLADSKGANTNKEKAKKASAAAKVARARRATALASATGSK